MINYYNLCKLRLCPCFVSSNDYSDVGGLTRDMAPELGPLSTKTIQIDKNDNAEGILQFSQDVYPGLVT